MYVFKQADLRKRALSAAYGGGLQWRKISILVNPKQFRWFLKSEKQKKKEKKKVMSLGPFDLLYLLAQLLLLFVEGPIYLLGPGEQHLKGGLSAVADTADS